MNFIINNFIMLWEQMSIPILTVKGWKHSQKSLKLGHQLMPHHVTYS